MRKSEAALAVIRRTSDSGSPWLALWNANWDAFHFVGGHRRPGEAYRDCLVREIFEELALRDGQDCRVDADPLAHLAYSAWSKGSDAETYYEMELFAVALNPAAEQALQANPDVRWLGLPEIHAESCHDGRPVSPTMGSLIARAGLS